MKESLQIINFEFDIVLFVTQVDALCVEKDLDFLEAVVHWCESNDIEIETVVPVIKKDLVLKQRLTEAANRKNFLKK